MPQCCHWWGGQTLPPKVVTRRKVLFAKHLKQYLACGKYLLKSKSINTFVSGPKMTTPTIVESVGQAKPPRCLGSGLLLETTFSLVGAQWLHWEVLTRHLCLSFLSNKGKCSSRVWDPKNHRESPLGSVTLVAHVLTCWYLTCQVK